jgi:hypothetical protein
VPTWQAESVNNGADRDRFADFLRLGSICAVVLGHWLLTLMITHGAGGLSELLPLRMSTWLWQVMPLFFVVGGFTHARSLRHRPTLALFLRARTNRLLPPALVFLVVWTLLAAVLWVSGLDRGPFSVAEDRVTAPLWFLGVYLLVVLLAPVMYRWHLRAGVSVPFWLAAGTVLVDLIGNNQIQMINVAFVWLAFHQLGFLYADGLLARRGVALLMTIGGLATVVMLTLVVPVYPVLMVGLPDQPLSNMVPPTFALLAHGVWLTGLALLCREPINRLLRRPRVWHAVLLGNSVIMTIFCWHLTAAFLTQGLVMLTGAPIPSAWRC